MDKKDANLLWVKIQMTNTTVYLHIYINVSVYLTIVVLAPPRFCISSSWPAFVQLPTINEQAWRRRFFFWRRRMLQLNYFLFTNHWMNYTTQVNGWTIALNRWARLGESCCPHFHIYIHAMQKLYDITPKYKVLGVLFKYLPVPRPVGPIQSTTGVKINRRDPPHL